MSHTPERKEKNCLNCGTIVQGKYCQACGQENVETRESFLALTKHFIYDVIHFDGKFFYTLKYIFTRPGYVARKYAEGKRASFLHPIRMYLFTSAIFFLVFFSVNTFHITDNEEGNLNRVQRQKLIERWERRLEKKPNDSVLLKRLAIVKDTNRIINFDSLGWRESGRTFSVGDQRSYSSLQEYDSVQNSLPEQQRESWFTRRLTRQSIKINTKYGGSAEGMNSFTDTILHKLPYLLFISLPFFALTLKLLYLRRKNFYYSDHATFTLFHYILSFIFILVGYGLNALAHRTGWAIFGWLITVVAVLWPIYLYIEMKTFYQQGYLKTFAKFLLLNLLGAVIILILFILFLFLSIFQA